MADLAERLQDPNERFSPQEIYELFEVIGSQHGWHRDERLPAAGTVRETTSMTIPHFEDLGVLVVRPRTIRDGAIAIPSLVDRILGDNLSPSQNTIFNAQLVALMQTVVVAPVGIVDKILNSSGDWLDRKIVEDGKTRSLSVFFEFAREYGEWMAARNQEAREKKSGDNPGKDAGIESAS